jgi:hypothetical protein
MIRPAVLTPTAFLAAACGGDLRPAVHATRADSAGVTIVTTVAGEFVASWSMFSAPAGGRVPPSGRLADGRWPGTGTVAFTAGQQGSGVTRRPMVWYRISRDLAQVEDTVTVLAGADIMVEVSTDPAGRTTGMRVRNPSIRRSSVAAVGPDFLVAGDSDHPEVRVYTPEGVLTTIARWDTPAVPVDAVLLERMKQAERNRAAGDTRAIEEIETPFGSPPPAFHTVLDIGRDRILTLWRDEDDLEYLRVYRIRK